jgi:hypothetical protein
LDFGVPAPTSPLALGLAAFRLWRRLPPAQRAVILEVARTRGPRVAAAAVAAASAARRRSAGS